MSTGAFAQVPAGGGVLVGECGGWSGEQDASAVAAGSWAEVDEAGVLTAVDEKSCRYTTPPDDWAWLAVTVAAVGVPYRVESPPELVAETRKLAARTSAATS